MKAAEPAAEPEAVAPRPNKTYEHWKAQYLRAHGAPLTEAMTTRAARLGEKDCLEYLLNINCPRSRTKMECVATCPDVLEVIRTLPLEQ